MMAAFSLLLPLVAYDLLSMRRIHRSTVLGGTWVVLIELTAIIVTHTAPWQSFAARVHLLLQ